MTSIVTNLIQIAAEWPTHLAYQAYQDEML